MTNFGPDVFLYTITSYLVVLIILAPAVVVTVGSGLNSTAPLICVLNLALASTMPSILPPTPTSFPWPLSRVTFGLSTNTS